MKRILLLTDSLALPREKPEFCAFEDSWPQLLKQTNLFEIHQCSIGGATSTDLLRQAHYYNTFNPDIVIVQVGIVDCTPRFISKKEKYLLAKIPVLGNKLIGYLNNPFVRERRNITYISKKEFLENLKKIKKLFKNKSKLFFVEIIGGEGYETLLPRVDDNINVYNNLLNEVSEVVRYNQKGITMSDYHHLNENGHFCLFEAITKNII